MCLYFRSYRSPVACLIVSRQYALAESSQALNWLAADGRNSTQLQAPSFSYGVLDLPARSALRLGKLIPAYLLVR